MLLTACVALATSLSSPSIAAVPKAPAAQSHPVGLNDRGFTENLGQWNPKVAFMARTGAADVWITKSSLVFSWRKNGQIYPVNMEFVGSSPKATAHGLSGIPGVSNYVIGHRSTMGVKSFREARIDNLYKGIDLDLTCENGLPKYDFIVHPGADAKQIRIRYSGARNLALAHGSARYETPFGSVADRKLAAYEDGSHNRVTVKEALRGPNTVGFDLGDYRQDKTLVIDPLVYGTYIGGSASGDFDQCTAVASGTDGSVYVCGNTQSSDFPVTNGSTRMGGQNNFVARFDPSHNVSYATYFGGDNSGAGNGGDYAGSIAVDASGNAYMCGFSGSDNLPVTDGSVFDQGSAGMQPMGYVAKFSPSGAVSYCKYLGGSYGSNLNSIAVTPGGVAAVCGVCGSLDYPTVNPLNETPNFVVASQISADGNSLLWSSYILGANAHNNTVPLAIKYDGSGNIYIEGETGDPNFPVTTGAFQSTLTNGGLFLTEINPTTSTIDYATVIGGGNGVQVVDYGLNELAVDTAGDAFVAGTLPAGYNNPGDYPIIGNPYMQFEANGQPFGLTEIAAGGSSAVFSTVIGGNGNWGQCKVFGLDVDSAGNLLVTGTTGSTDFPVTNGAYQSSFSFNSGFVLQLSPGGTSLLYSSYFPGVNAGGCYDASGNAVLAGAAVLPNLTTTPNAWVPSYNANGNGMGYLGIVQMQELTGLSVPATTTGGSSVTGTVGISGIAPASGSGYAISLSSSNPGVASVPATVTIPAGQSSASFTITTSVPVSPATVTITATDGAGSQSAPISVSTGALTSVSTASTSVLGGTSTTGFLNFSNPVPVGAMVALSSNSSSANVPAAVTVTGSPTSFTVSTSAVTSNTSATISASLNGVTMTTGLTVDAPTITVTVDSLTLKPKTVVCGKGSIGTVKLSGPAPAGGVTVQLAPATGAAFTLGSVRVAAGSDTATFQIGTSAVKTETTVTISAALGHTKTATLKVTPPKVKSLKLSPTSVVGGNNSTGTVEIGHALSIAYPMALSSDSTSATVPATVKIPAGQTSATFTVTTVAVASDTTAKISATTKDTVSATLTIKAPTISSLSVPSSITTSGSGTCTVTISSAAPSGDLTITLGSTNSDASVPGTVKILAGQTSATFKVTGLGHVLTSSEKGDITATLNGAQTSASITVKK